VLKVARKQLDPLITEDPADSNLTKFGKAYDLNGVAWCGIFALSLFPTLQEP
jgi:hypothetical protein